MGTPSAGASIAVASGNHEINAPVTLANNLVISGSGVLTFGTSSTLWDNNSGYSLTMNGSGGGLILNGSDSFSGGTIVSAGTLAVTDAAALPANQTLTISAGGTFIFDPLATASSLTASPAASPDAAYAAQPAPCAVWWRRFPNRQRSRCCWRPFAVRRGTWHSGSAAACQDSEIARSVASGGLRERQRRLAGLA